MLRSLPKALRAAARCQQQQRRSQSVVSDFLKKMKSEVDSNPELKKSVETLKEKTKVASEQVQKAAAAAQSATQQATQQLSQQAAQATASVQETISQAAKSVRNPDEQQRQQQQQQQDGDAASSGAGPSGGAQSAAGPSEASSAGGSTSSDGSASTADAPPKPPVVERLRHIASVVWKEVAEVVSPQDTSESALRRKVPPAEDQGAYASDASELAVVQAKESAWQQQWQTMRNKFGGHPLFQRLHGLRDSKFVEKGREAVEKGREAVGDMRDRWETSDSPLVHRIQDMSDSMFSESEAARALREIRSRDPGFDMVAFLRLLKGDVITVIQAYLTGDAKALAEHCSPEMVERLMGIVAAMHAQGLYSDPTILDTSEVELVDLKFLEDEPIVVVQFNCQQINCSRDKFGNVVDGAPDSVHRVYYYWALQQAPAGYVGVDGRYHPPAWQLKEMLVRGMHNLL